MCEQVVREQSVCKMCDDKLYVCKLCEDKLVRTRCV